MKLFDAGGLFLLVTATGFKSWRLKYRFGQKEKQLTFGPYPEVTLREARDRRDEARRLLRDGIDPGQVRKRQLAEKRLGVDQKRTFRAIALRWHAQHLPGWKERHAQDVLTSLEKEAFPAFGEVDIASITPADIRPLLQGIQARGAIEAAWRLRSRLSAVFSLAIASGLTDIDPAASLQAILQPVVKRMHPALRTLPELQAFLRAMEGEPAYPTTRLASRLLALTAARPGMVQLAQPGEFEDLDGEQPIWRVPAEKMKLQRAESEQSAFEFILPLSRQAVETVKVAMAHAGRRAYLFPSSRYSHRPIDANALNVNYRRVPGFGGRHVPHGWRASFSTIMNERASVLDRPADRAIIDLMLAHQPSGVEALYNRAAYMPRRRAIAQEWADLLLEGMPGPETLVEGPRKR